MSRSKQYRLLVIDASIARATGETLRHPTSTSCREALDTIKRIGHRIAMSYPLKKEWDEHQSTYARKWRVQMVKMKKYEIVLIPEDTQFRRDLQSVIDNPKDQAELEKDRHLVETAMIVKGPVLSLDESARRLFSQASQHFPKLSSLDWANPDRIEDAVREWLERGAPLEDHRKLRHK